MDELLSDGGGGARAGGVGFEFVFGTCCFSCACRIKSHDVGWVVGRAERISDQRELGSDEDASGDEVAPSGPACE